jgi:alpha-ketoglutarate-dependent taurine dioxygenase
MRTSVTPVKPDVGVEITGMSGRELADRAVAAELQAALDEHGVVIYREANVDDDDLVALSRVLGEVVVPKVGGDAAHPEVSTISLDPSKSKLAAYQRGTFFWHIDGATDEVPQKATFLTCREVSDDGGGDTEFANTYAAYAALPHTEQEQLAGVRVVHSFAAAQSLTYPEPSEHERSAWDRVPAREHPLVWTHRSGRKSLLLGATAGQVVGRSLDEGTALLARLLEWSTQDRFVLRHHWRRGDLVVWDNTGMLHRALPYAPTSRRLMRRTTLVGEEAVA